MCKQREFSQKNLSLIFISTKSHIWIKSGFPILNSDGKINEHVIYRGEKDEIKTKIRK